MPIELSHAAHTTLSAIAAKYGRYRAFRIHNESAEFNGTAVQELIKNGLLREDNLLILKEFKRSADQGQGGVGILTDVALANYRSLFTNGMLGSKEDSPAQRRAIEKEFLTLPVEPGDLRPSRNATRRPVGVPMVDREPTREAYRFIPQTEEVWKQSLEEAFDAYKRGTLHSIDGNKGWEIGSKLLEDVKKNGGYLGNLSTNKKAQLKQLGKPTLPALPADIFLYIERDMLRLQDYPIALRNLQLEAASLVRDIHKYDSYDVALSMRQRPGESFASKYTSLVASDMERDERISRVASLYALAGQMKLTAVPYNHILQSAVFPEFGRTRLPEVALNIAQRAHIGAHGFMWDRLVPKEGESRALMTELNNEVLKLPDRDIQEILKIHAENVSNGSWKGPEWALPAKRATTTQLSGAVSGPSMAAVASSPVPGVISSPAASTTGHPAHPTPPAASGFLGQGGRSIG
ncbi:hypothetical protein ACFV2D_37270 [Streptomyces capillispiralis]|uniref:hypothetical protein n=1 Tax=Streptomyces capillispiralis TaxID=68182 RepID=UPI0036B95910